MDIMTRFQRLIPSSIALIAPLLLVLIGCIETARPAPATALARPANVPVAIGQTVTDLPDDDAALAGGTAAPPISAGTSHLSPMATVSTAGGPAVHAATSDISYTAYLPVMTKNGGARFVQLGADFGPSLLLSDTSVLTADLAPARDLGTTWARAWLPWAQIERAPGNYDWTWADRQINQFAAAGFKIDSVIYYPPAWAAASGCGPITNTVAFNQFMTAVVSRYRDLVDAWEFINEPDSPTGMPNYGPAIGCWALQPQTYVDRLALFHEYVTELDPTAQVVLGGLAYDNWQIFDRDFFTHTLQSGAGPHFDVVSLHFYPINPQDFPTMAHKINEIKAIMQRHGVYDKPIWVTETSMWSNGPDGLAGQRNYIVEEQARAFCAGADKLFWFAIREELSPPPLKRWLINKQHQLDQGYATYQNFARQLEGAFCRGAYLQVPANVEAYRFGAPAGEVYILWTNRGTANVTVPAGSSAALIDRDGLTTQPLTPSGGMVSFPVSTRPVFVVVNY
jgi:hypothetical protein